MHLIIFNYTLYAIPTYFIIIIFICLKVVKWTHRNGTPDLD